MELNSYELSRNWFDWSYENPELITPTHVALYFFIIEHCNRLGWKEKFGLPTTMAKEAIGIKSYKTYISALNDLIEWGFIKMVQKSTNQYSANIIALVKNTKAHTKALTKATAKHVSKQVQSNDSIDKPNNLLTNNLITKEQEFERFWNLYGKKVGREKSVKKFMSLSLSEIELIFIHVPEYVKSTPEIKYRKDPIRYLTNKCWNDDCIPTIQNRNFEVSGRTNDGGRFKRFVTHEELEKLKTNSYFKIESVI